MKKAAYFTLGCKVNQYETEVIRQLFESEGYLTCPPNEEPDLAILNSCTVTGQGDRKTQKQLRKMRRMWPNACLVLCGCFPQAYAEEAAVLEEADVITGTSGRMILPSLVRQYMETKEKVVQILPHEKGESFESLSAVSFAERTRAYLKIQDGCQRRCAYCIIPDARGYLRSKPLAELKKELAELAQMGYLEVVLVGINLSMYGGEEGYTLADAVEAAEATKGLQRVRLGSLEPDLIDDKMLARLAACKKLCPQFHIALQSGCDNTLKRMRRHYSTAEYADLAVKIRHYFPGAALTTDVMVGFAGETEEDFMVSMAFVKEIGFAKVHVFPYSIRPGTPAADFPNQVKEEEKSRRSAQMIAAADVLRQSFLTAKIGTHEVVLIEREKDGSLFGHTADYTPVRIPNAASMKNTMVSVTITECEADGCIAKL